MYNFIYIKTSVLYNNYNILILYTPLYIYNNNISIIPLYIYNHNIKYEFNCLNLLKHRILAVLNIIKFIILI